MFKASRIFNRIGISKQKPFAIELEGGKDAEEELYGARASRARVTKRDVRRVYLVYLCHYLELRVEQSVPHVQPSFRKIS
jgi:hypothetical protein